MISHLTTGRVCYRRLVDDEVSPAIADIFEDGTYRFAESEWGGVRWFDFQPTTDELAFVQRLLGGGRPADWSAIFVVDEPAVITWRGGQAGDQQMPLTAAA